MQSNPTNPLTQICSLIAEFEIQISHLGNTNFVVCLPHSDFCSISKIKKKSNFVFYLILAQISLVSFLLSQGKKRTLWDYLMIYTSDPSLTFPLLHLPFLTSFSLPPSHLYPFFSNSHNYFHLPFFNVLCFLCSRCGMDSATGD